MRIGAPVTRSFLPKARTRAILVGLVATWLGACGSSSITNPGGTADSPIGSSFPDGASFDARVNCSSAQQCTGGQICDPNTMKCTGTLACNSHMDCGGGAYCTPSNSCSPNMLYGPCDDTVNCINDETCENGHCGCGGQAFTATVVPPNMLIALDRSQSMNTTVPGTGDSRYTVATNAIQNLTTMYQGQIRFGLALWPGESKSCSTGSDHQCMGVNEAIDMALNTGTAIKDYLDTSGRCSLGTPITNTLTVLDGYAGFSDNTRANYLVLMTDGDQANCTGDPAAATTALRGHNPEVKTFAIGFGGEVDATTLTNIATAGGTARTGTPKYYQADDQAGLMTAFRDIAGKIVGCDYLLDSQPDDPTRLLVFLGDNMLPRDANHANGWDYITGTQHLTFYGSTCSQVSSGTGGALSITFQCPVIP